ncbi:MAG TPA: hypothetical protein VIK38_01045, partial [Coriobacteriia bacterium]
MAVRRSIRPWFFVDRTSPPPGRGEAVESARVTPPDTQIVRFAVGLRGRYLLAIDLIGIVVAAYLALALRFDRLSGPFAVPAFPVVVGLLLAIRTIINVQLGLYSRGWRFASVPDLERIVAAVALGSLLTLVTFYGASGVADATWPDGFPRSFWLAEALLSVAILGGVRFGIRAAFEAARSGTQTASADRRATL